MLTPLPSLSFTLQPPRPSARAQPTRSDGGSDGGGGGSDGDGGVARQNKRMRSDVEQHKMDLEALRRKARIQTDMSADITTDIRSHKRPDVPSW